MKVLAILLVSLVTFAAAKSTTDLPPEDLIDDIKEQWELFKSRFNKTYSLSEASIRFKRFAKNLKTIREHHKRFKEGLVSYDFGVNGLSDLSLEEFKSTHFGFVLTPEAEKLWANASKHIMTENVKLPLKHEWKRECVQGVKNQGNCGSCYAFSAIAALESAWCERHGGIHDLSEQQALDCSDNGGCEGGSMLAVYEYIQRRGGVTQQHIYPYKATKEQCQDGDKPMVNDVESYTIVESDENAVMHALTSVGALSVAYFAEENAHQHYQGGVMDVENCPSGANHAVLLTGFGNDNGRDYWLLKNSWGPEWGEGGYLRLARGKNMCEIGNHATYPIAR